MKSIEIAVLPRLSYDRVLGAMPAVPSCKDCGSALARAEKGAYRGFFYCPNFCDQFGPPATRPENHFDRDFDGPHT